MNKLTFFIAGFISLLLGVTGYMATLQPVTHDMTYWDHFFLNLILVALISPIVILIELFVGGFDELDKRTSSQNELAFAFLAGLFYPLWRAGKFIHRFSKLDK